MGLLTVPRNYTPRKGGKKFPRENLIYASKAEQEMLRRMTDGKADMTKYGILSFTHANDRGTTGMQQGSNNYNSTSNAASRTSTSSNNGSRGTTGMQQGSNNYNSPSNSASRSGQTNSSGQTSSSGRSNTNTGRTGTGGSMNVGRGGSGVGGGLGFGATGFSANASRGGGISTPFGSGSPRNNPVSINVAPGNGSLRNAMTQRQAVNQMAPQNMGQRANPSYFGDFKSPTQDFTSPEQEAELDRIRGVVNRVPVSMPDRSAFASTFPARPEAKNWGQEQPQQQQNTGNPMSNPNSAGRYGLPGQGSQGYRSLANAVTTIGGSPEQQIDSVLKNMGYDNPFGRAAAIGRFDVETGGFDPKVFSGQRMGDDGTAYGLAQWRGDRQAAAKAYADQMGVPGANVAGQAAFAGKEMRDSYPQSYAQLQNATSIADAMRGMNSYERPQGYKPGGDPTRVSGYADSMNRAQQFMGGQTGPTQVASINPAVAPPSPQQSMPQTTAQPIPQPQTGTEPSMWEKYAPQGLQQAVAQAPQAYDAFTAANKKINEMGGGERVQKLGKVAQAIMSFMPGGDGLKNQRGVDRGQGGGGNGYTDPRKPNAPPRTQDAAAPVVPPAQPAPANWMYPTYTQDWAGLPTGIGGPIWRPPAPAAGLFDDAKDKKKGGRKKEGTTNVARTVRPPRNSRAHEGLLSVVA